MKFKIGDKVKVRKDLKAGEEHGYYFNDEMFEMRGKTVTITCVYNDSYRIKEAGYFWTDEMFEEIEPKNKFKVGQKVRIKRTDRVGKVNLKDNCDFNSGGYSNRCYQVKCEDGFFDWFTVHDLEEVKEILDDVERKYLSDVIKPFKSKVIDIERFESFNGKQFIRIRANSIEKDIGTECVDLPFFKKNTMYKGMETNKPYTLKELNLED